MIAYTINVSSYITMDDYLVGSRHLWSPPLSLCNLLLFFSDKAHGHIFPKHFFLGVGVP